jgi:hypothetical protein
LCFQASVECLIITKAALSHINFSDGLIRHMIL